MACKQQPGRAADHDGVEVVARARRAAAGGLRAVRVGLWCPHPEQQTASVFKGTGRWFRRVVHVRQVEGGLAFAGSFRPGTRACPARGYKARGLSAFAVGMRESATRESAFGGQERAIFTLNATARLQLPNHRRFSSGGA